MPIGFSSAPRNLFLFGSAGSDIVTNFFKTINQSAGTDEVFVTDEIKYNYTDQKYVLSGSAVDSNSKSFGWFEKRDDAGTADWDVRIEAGAGVNTTLRAMELDSNNNLIVVGKSGNAPWIAKYSNSGVIDWQKTTFSADVEYTGITSDTNGIYYACGSTPESGFAQAFVEKYTNTGTPDWGKSAFMLGRDVVLNAIDCNSRGEVVAVGHLEDDTNEKGYIFKIDTTTGDVMWDRTLTLDGVDIQCTDIFIDTNDQIYVTASTDTYGYLLKYTAEGNMIWQKRTNQSSGTIRYNQVHSDGGTEQTVVFAQYDDGSDTVGMMTKYSQNGDLVWRRTLKSSFNNSDTFSNLCLDADPSFYYFLYTDSPVNASNGTPDKYTFGKVSSSGNGLGSFQYNEGTGQTIDYDIVSIGDVIGRLSDGSVRNDSSDLITYPISGTRILFDDLATHVSNKRRQMDGPGSFEYSASGSAIGVADFQQELNLLGSVYSGSGDWLDQSGEGNDATTSYTTTAEEPFSGAGSIEFDGNGDSISVGALLPTSTGTAFTVDMFWYSKSNTSQKCLWEQHGGGSGRTGYFVDGTNAFLVSEGNVIGNFAYSDNVWYFTRVTYTAGGAIEVFVDGVSRGTGTQTVGVDNVNFVVGDRSGASESFNGYISNVRVITGSALSGAGQVPTSALTNTGQTTVSNSYSTIYSSMLTSGGLKTPTAGFTEPHSNTGTNPIRSEGTGGLLFTPTTAIPYSSQVEVLDNNTVTACWFNQTNSNGSSTSHNNGWITVASGSGTINTMYFERTDNSSWDAGFCAIRVDGTILADTVWSPDDALSSSAGPSNLFDGNTGTRVETVSAGGTVRWTPDTTISWSSSLRINTGAYSGSITVRANGTTTVLHPNGTQVQSPYWTSHPNSSGTIEYIEAQGHIGAGVGYMTAIEVDGTILVNGSGGTTGTMLLTAQGSSITDASDSNLSITVNGDAAASVSSTNTVAYNASGKYFELDGTDDYITLGTKDFITTQHSVEMWVNISAAKEHYFFSFGYQDDLSAVIYAQTSTQELTVTWRVGGANQSPILTGENLSTNQWYHIVWTRDGATNKIYLDGVEVGSSTTQTTASLPACIYDIGWATTRDKATAFTQGKIGDVRIYDTALTAAQAFQNYNSTKETHTGVAASTNPGLTSTRTP